MEAIPARLAAALAGRYRIEREIGAGGAATVYLADDLKHDRRVAIKVLRPQIAEALGPERFEDEIRIAARLHHPHILAVHDSGEADGFLYYVMPFVEGQSLRERLQDGGRMPVSQVARILSEVADALADAHAAGIVHRDIKPENILLSGRHALVADFGVAKAISDAGNRKTTTSMGLALGTPAYMSPEQATADPALDHRADLYALGVVAYEMLAGHPPFSGTAQQILAAHTVTPPEPIAKLRPDIPSALGTLVMRSLAKSPGDRWQTAEAMQAQLEPMIGSSSGGITPTMVLPGAARRIPDRRTPWRAMGIVSSLIVAALVAGLAWRANTGHPGAAPATAAGQGADATTLAGVAAALPGNDKSLAVLPFANLSSDKDNAYFADGIQDEIIARLSKIGDIKVISRTSTLRYASNPENLPQIAKELGVANILEGSVQKVGGSVRINVQLVRARDDSHLWAEIYDRKLTDVFGIQSEVASAIALALKATLTSSEQAQVAATPTTNPAAYDAYLKGLSVEGRANYSATQNSRARDFYIEATRLDPTFVDAWVHLASVRSFLYANGVDSNPVGGARVKEAADAVARLRPGSAEAWLTTGFYRYRVLHDLQGALDSFGRAAATLPNNADIAGVQGAVERRLGRMSEAEAHLQRAAQLDPGNGSWLGTYAEVLAGQRRFPEARAVYDRALRLSPGDTDFLAYKVSSYQSEGNLDAAAALLATMSPPRDGEDRSLGARSYQALVQGRFDEALAHCPMLATPVRPGTDGMRQRSAALLCAASLLRIKGEQAAARAKCEEAAPIVSKLVDAIGDDTTLGDQADILACRGDKAQALATVDKAIRLAGGDAKQLPGYLVQRAEFLARFSDKPAAIDQLATLLRVPYGVTKADLRLDPRWTMLRSDPRFIALTK